MADTIATPIAVAIGAIDGASIDTVAVPPNFQVQSAVPAPAATTPRQPRGPTKFQLMNTRYALPAPLRTFPLPTFVPHNPLSLLQILYIWVSQIISPQSSAFDPLYQGWFSAETRSVHVTEPRSIKALWDQGFYGKGNLSRSEPNWLKAEKEKQARGSSKAKTSEELTRKRRRERQQVKWERARLQKEAIDQKLLEEAEAANSPDIAINGNPLPVEISFNVSAVMDSPPELSTSDDASDVSTPTPRGFVSPVGPLELLQLPNSEAEIASFSNCAKALVTTIHASSEEEQHSPKLGGLSHIYHAPVGPRQLLALPNSASDLAALDIEESTPQLESSIQTSTAEEFEVQVEDLISKDIHTNGLHMNGYTKSEDTVSTSVTSDEVSMASTHTEDTTIEGPILDTTRRIKRQKSVRFSPTVEQTTFMQSQPPSPERSIEVLEAPAAIEVAIETNPLPLIIKDQEHTQLTLEEAFFLSYALGSLSIHDPQTKTPISNFQLLSLFRRTSYFPPLAPGNLLAPDDPFMLNYTVYHHFRSLGWCVRSGVKFSVDFMLYTRGPPFSHAEFAVLVLPSYSDSYWEGREEKGVERRTWAWLSSINRVITQVKKTVVLCYVDVPPPITERAEERLGTAGVLRRYKVREFVIKRWVSNRHRSG